MHKSALEKNLTSWVFAKEINNSASDVEMKTVFINYKKLLLNYCFGHPKSSVRLCPYGSTSHLINHASDIDMVNAEVQWSTSSLINSTRLEESLENLLEKKQPAGILFDIVATRDIFPDEEIFINYGKEWENSWNDHKRSWDAIYGWKPREQQNQSMRLDNNNEFFVTLPNKNATDNNIDFSNEKKMACYYNFHSPTVKNNNVFKMNQHYLNAADQQEMKTLSNQQAVYNNSHGNKDITNSSWSPPSDEENEYEWVYVNCRNQDLGGLYPCDINFKEIQTRSLAENDWKQTFYSTRIYSLGSRYSSTKRKFRTVRFVPRKAIVLVNERWLSDFSASTASDIKTYGNANTGSNNTDTIVDFPAFRHYIVIPDDILPASWKDLEKES